MADEQRLKDEIAHLQDQLRVARAAAANNPPVVNSGTDVNNTAGGTVNKVAIKIGPFWKRDPTLWFAQLEAQFTLNQVTREDTRYFHVLAAIDSEILACCSDIIRDPPANGKYSALKDRIISEYSTSEQNRMQQLLRGCELGDRKPSQLLREMRDLARDVITDEKIIKSLWMQQLPETTQAVLKVSEATLQLAQLAEQADKLADITRTRSISSAGTTWEDNKDIGFEELRKQISVLSDEIAAFRQERGRPRSRSFSRFLGGTRSGSRGNHPYCFYHRKFGANARSCRSPCQFKQKN
ncbi:uncharacterized protein LOC115269770 [Aedes albopictus]|uniref:DUF7041 domain-containing protein n=1 Tax=Aedes albopictus TaxID=7160 RepID=A0ABM1YR27_AEDAL|nr:uncharacterized protein LOC115269770 [Aedes albopictus]XP_029734454.1 uncharacterized protein LOC115269784 [Aedes albopictus]